MQVQQLQYKRSAMSLNVRPNKVIEAALWLIRNSDLCKHEGVTLNENWVTNYQEEQLQQNEINETILSNDIHCNADSPTNSTEVTNDDNQTNNSVENGECSEDEVEMDAMGYRFTEERIFVDKGATTSCPNEKISFQLPTRDHFPWNGLKDTQALDTALLLMLCFVKSPFVTTGFQQCNNAFDTERGMITQHVISETDKNHV